MGCGSSTYPQETWNQEYYDDLYTIYSNMGLGLSEKSLEDYLRIEKDIQLFEQRRVKETLNVRLEQLEKLNETLSDLEKEVVSLQSKAGVASEPMIMREDDKGKYVRNFLMKLNKYDEDTAYEKAELLANLNRIEILSRKIEGVMAHKHVLEQEIAALTEDVGKYAFLCEREEAMLASIFNGEYGSPLENQLEKELDEAEVWKQQVEVTDFKWRQAHIMVEFSCKQLATGVSQWIEITKLPIKNIDPRYKLAEETRNNMTAAFQNLQGAQKYLSNISFPYCTKAELQTLFQATSYVFTDMQSEDRIKHALDFYITTLKRCNALRQWFEEVLNITLDELAKANHDVLEKRKRLYKERVLLLREKIAEAFGKEVNFDLDEMAKKITQDSEEDIEEKIRRRTRQESSNPIKVQMPDGERTYSPIKKSELAPPPTYEELFGKPKAPDGDIDMDKDTEDLLKETEPQYDLMDSSSLDFVMQQRRNRRARMRLQSVEIQELAARIQKLTGMGVVKEEGKTKKLIHEDSLDEIDLPPNYTRKDMGGLK